MSCILIIEGEKFEVDSFLLSTKMEAYSVWRAGEMKEIRKSGNPKHLTSGCKIDVSKEDFNRFDLQKKDATRFFELNINELKRLAEFGLNQNENPVLDFAIYSRMAEVGAQFDRFEPTLLKALGDLGFVLELSQYEPEE